jgi:hypothetical protein
MGPPGPGITDVSYWHWTCRHSAESIDTTLILQPHRQPLLANVPMIWFTSVQSAGRNHLGLTSNTLECDRMDRMYRVIEEDEHLVVRWGDLKRAPQFTGYLAGARRLESVRGTRPGLWAVAVEPVRVVAVWPK